VQSLGELKARKIDGTDGAAFPFWSHDGKFVGFFGDGHLKKVPGAGGPVTILADAPNPRGGTWNQDNVIVFEPDYRESLWKISAAGGKPALTKLKRQAYDRWPQFCGQAFCFATNHRAIPNRGSTSVRLPTVRTGTLSTPIQALSMAPAICFSSSVGCWLEFDPSMEQCQAIATGGEFCGTRSWERGTTRR
jgi:hypothetical protein